MHLPSWVEMEPGIWESLLLPARQQSLILPLGIVIWVPAVRAGRSLGTALPARGIEHLGFLRVVICWAERGLGRYSPPLLSPEEGLPSSSHPSHCWQIFQTSASALGLRTGRTCLPSILADVSASQSVLAVPGVQLHCSPEPSIIWACDPSADLQGQVCSTSGFLLPHHSFLLSPACRLVWGEDLGPS